MFTELKVKDETYKLRLNTRGVIQLEKALGYNPIDILMKIEDNIMPTLSDCMVILHSCLQGYNHGFTLEKTFNLFDEYVADGHTLFDLIPLFVDVFQECGLIELGGDQEKN